MNLKPLLSPESVALIGASNREGSIGFEAVNMILKAGYQGEIYPVNPRYDSVLGLKCYPSLDAIGKPVDLAALCISARRLDAQVQEAIASGVKSLVIVPNAIIENDTEPPCAERLRLMLEDANIPVSGHNSMGLYNNDLNLRVCGFKAPDEGSRGGIAFISQSGSVFSTIAHNDPQLKFNLAITTGTELNITVADYILYALEQSSTQVIGLFLETIRDPDLFRAALQKAAEKRIPVVAMKVGKSDLGAKFTVSHSGGLAGNDDAINAVFNHYGVIRASDLDEMANLLLLCSYYPILGSGKVSMIADSGGERNLLADEFDDIGLEFAELSKDTMKKLADIQEYGQEAANPLDPWGTGIDFESIVGNSLALMSNDENTAICILSQDIRDDNFLTVGFIEAMQIALTKTDKPLVHMTNYTGVRRTGTTEKLNDLGIPVTCGTRASLNAIKHLIEFRDFRFQQRKAKSSGSPTDSSIQGVLQEYEALQLLGDFGMPVVDCFPIHSVSDCKELSQAIRFPVVLKTAMPGIIHKTDVGGVVADIANTSILEKEYLQMQKSLGAKAIVQPMTQFDFELILGVKTDDVFGQLIIVGAGGILTEYYKDTCVFLPEASENEIEAGLRGLKISPLFKGVRGKQPVDVSTLVQIISKFCEFVMQFRDQIAEIDINPLAVSGSSIVALDAIIVGRETTSQ